jgi:outer membrane protein assembly factor BamB
VLTGRQPTYYGWNSRGRVIGCAGPGVQVFDLASGNRLWSVELASEPNRFQMTPMGLTRNYVAAVVKDNAITQAGTVWLIDRQTGRVAQKIELPGVQNMPQPSGFFMHMAMGAPVAVKDRLVVETLTGIEVYGKKASGDATTQPATRATNAP